MEASLFIKRNNQLTKQSTKLLPVLLTLFSFTAQAEIHQKPVPNASILAGVFTIANNAAAAVASNAVTYIAPDENLAPTNAAAKVENAKPVNADNIERINAADVTPAQRRQHIVWFAQSYSDWGIKYSLGSSSVEDGFDCSGFVRYVLNYFDIKTKRTSGEQYESGGKQIAVEKARAGDLVFFGGKRSVSHVAMVLSNDEKGLVVVHSACSKGVSIENITKSKYWKPKLKDKAVDILGD